MLATLLVMPPLFYRAGKPAGESMTQLRGQYRQQLTAWLQGQAELMVFNASDRYRAQMEKTELSWQDAQRRQAELTALSQAVMLLIGGIAVVAMLWLASDGVGGNSQPGALIALFVFCALAAFEALAPVTGAFQHLGQVIASARRISQITDQQPEVTFVEDEASSPAQVALTLREVTFRYPQQPSPALENISCRLPPESTSPFLAGPAAENRRCCSCLPAPGTRHRERFCSTISRSPASAKPLCGRQ